MLISSSSNATWVTASARSLTLCSRPTTRPSAMMMTPTISQRPGHHLLHLLQRLRRLPHRRRHRHLQTTAVTCVWWGSEMASHLSLAAMRGSALLVSTLSSIWAPAARSVALISRWWCVCITDTTEHCSSHNGRNWFTMSVTYVCELLGTFIFYGMFIICDDELLIMQYIALANK